MSLNVPADLLDLAERGPVDDADFVACVRESLPYAWQVVSGVAADLANGAAEFADNETPPPTRPTADNCCAPWRSTPSAAHWNATSV